MELGELQRGWINLEVIDGGKISVGADWWKVLMVRDLPGAG